MRDDPRWWDDDDDERVAALQRKLAPLREPPRPWGDLLARARLGAGPQRRASSLGRRAGVVAALAAALFVAWIWGRPSEPRVMTVVEHGMGVAASRIEPPAPVIVRVPESMPHDELVKLLENMERNKTLKALVELGREADEDAATKKRVRRAPENPPKEELDVDCILDPTLPKCRGGTTAQDDLPKTLTLEDWVAGLARIKPAAKACAVKHAMAPDDHVTVGLTVEGASGRVTAANGFARLANGPLADCVATAVMKARFRRFRDATAHAMLPVTMPEAETPPAEKTAPPPKQESGKDVSCILDPVSSKCLKGTDDDLPDTLNTTDIKTGIEPVKVQAKACGAKHGAKSGVMVKIKLSVSGATGRVTSAVAQSPHAETALGACVADALAKARFRRFRKASLGVVYPITM